MSKAGHTSYNFLVQFPFRFTKTIDYEVTPKYFQLVCNQALTPHLKVNLREIEQQNCMMCGQLKFFYSPFSVHGFCAVHILGTLCTGTICGCLCTLQQW